MKICIIGAGIVGCSIGFELQRRGCQVVVVDSNGDVGHGSTSASCAIVRRFYSQPGMIAMAHEGASIWADWKSYLGTINDDTAVFLRPGMLFIPPKIDDTVRGIVAEMQRLNIPVELLSREDVSERFPFLNLSSEFPPRSVDDPKFLESGEAPIEGAVFEMDAGYVVSPGLATQNLRLAGEREGVCFRLKAEVVGVRQRSGGGFHVVINDGDSIDCDVLVNAAGPHSSKVNQLAGVELPLVTRALRREVHVVTNPRYTDEMGGQVPVVGDLNGGVYFRPESGGRELIVGTTDPDCDAQEWIDNPDDFGLTLTENYHQRQCLRLMKRFPDVRLGPARGIAALYDVTVRDWYPIADRTDQPGYYVCIGTSGSSFKTAPVLGRLMAEMIEACEGGYDHDRDPLQFELPRIGVSVDTRFLSRLRGEIKTTGTVIG